ncbi:MAG: glycoside hydrolase family 3 protein [Pyrinomonadaceae bacterium]
MMKQFLTLLITTIAFAGAISAQTRFRPSEKDYKNADKLLKTMSLDEKIGQMVHIGINAEFMNQDSYEFKRLQSQVADLKIGGIVVFAGGVYETTHLLNRMQATAKYPLLISSDFETGVGMRFSETVNFPWNMAVGATGNPEYARRIGEITAREARALGIQQVFAPVVDVNNNSDNPVINVRSFGEDPKAVGEFGSAFSEGLQSANILATAKHFPGHGDTAVDSHRGLPVINLSRSRLETVEFAPFRDTIRNGVGSVMISHISMPQLDPEKVQPLKTSVTPEYTESEVITDGTTVPATMSKPIVTGILKDEMGFDGLIVTDAMDMSGLTLYFNYEEAGARAVIAGNDVLLKTSRPEATINGIRKAVAEGRITEERINESARKIVAWKYKLGLFKNRITPLDRIDQIVSNKETRDLSNQVAEKAITLVESDGATLPLKSGTSVALICVTNSRDIDFVGRFFAGALSRRGLKVNRIALDDRSTPEEIQSAIDAAHKADVTVAGLFGRVRSGAKNSVGIPDAGAKVLDTILAEEKPVISVAFGNPYLILNFPTMKNYIVAYGDMYSLQEATANKITGGSNFTGKLPITIGKYPRGTGL